MKPLKSKPNRDNGIIWAKKARAELLKLIKTIQNLYQTILISKYITKNNK